ncbi:COQ9 family protein [Stakelama tenebrarum]|uniref:COQ9 family protein n=1 Tax=Stakelama tenebrarum TaxID=2711215 RepID=A0A6G6Y193_9SPHN|nr:COQ9 family protein [Sphingosinithalassobacter tenebrarum]QIG78488.1 COQ9 family protein [Sphingosinithalassobacter tenebrarum]
MARDLSDATLDELRPALAGDVATNAAFDGWNSEAVAMAAATNGVDADVATLVYPGGAPDMIDAWFESIDAAMAQRFAGGALDNMKIRERIAALVETRLELMSGKREALRRALAILAMPQNATRAARLGWRSADRMWRLAGDTATDYNHYTKRGMLAGIYAATVLVFLDDESEDHEATRAFLSRRIDNVMQFEKTKAKWLGSAERRPSLSRFIGRLRYPAV